MKPKPHPIAWTRDSSPSSLYVYPLTTQRPPLQPLSFSSHVRLSYPRFPSDLDTCLSTPPRLCITNFTPLGHRSRYVGAGRAVLCELSWPYQRPRVLPTYALTATSPPPSLPDQNPHPSRRYHLSTGRPRRQQRSDCVRESWSPVCSVAVQPVAAAQHLHFPLRHAPRVRAALHSCMCDVQRPVG